MLSRDNVNPSFLRLEYGYLHLTPGLPASYTATSSVQFTAFTKNMPLHEILVGKLENGVTSPCLI